MLENNMKLLVCAILEQAYTDYLYRDKDSLTNDKKFKDFCYKSKWFKFVNIDRDYFYEKTMEKKRRLRNGKKEK